MPAPSERRLLRGRADEATDAHDRRRSADPPPLAGRGRRRAAGRGRTRHWRAAAAPGRPSARNALHVRRFDPRLRSLQRSRRRSRTAPRAQRRRALSRIPRSRPRRAPGRAGAARPPGRRRLDLGGPRAPAARPRRWGGRRSRGRDRHDRRQRPAARPRRRTRRPRRPSLRRDARALRRGAAGADYRLRHGLRPDVRRRPEELPRRAAGDRAAALGRVNDAIRAVARRHGRVADLHAHFLRGDPSWFTNTIEPSLRGASEVRRVFLDAI